VHECQTSEGSSGAVAASALPAFKLPALTAAGGQDAHGDLRSPEPSRLPHPDGQAVAAPPADRQVAAVVWRGLSRLQSLIGLHLPLVPFQTRLQEAVEAFLLFKHILLTNNRTENH
jgi:hypothetical protein